MQYRVVKQFYTTVLYTLESSKALSCTQPEGVIVQSLLKVSKLCNGTYLNKALEIHWM